MASMPYTLRQPIIFLVWVIYFVLEALNFFGIIELIPTMQPLLDRKRSDIRIFPGRA